MESWFQVYIIQSPGQLSKVQFESSMMNEFIDLLQFTSQQQQQLSDHNSLKLFILVKTLVSINNQLVGMMSNLDPRNIGPLVCPQRNFGPFHCVVASCVVAPPTRGKSSSHQLDQRNLSVVVGSDGTERPHQLHAVLSAQSAVGGELHCSCGVSLIYCLLIKH